MKIKKLWLDHQTDLVECIIENGIIIYRYNHYTNDKAYFFNDKFGNVTYKGNFKYHEYEKINQLQNDLEIQYKMELERIEREQKLNRILECKKS